MQPDRDPCLVDLLDELSDPLEHLVLLCKCLPLVDDSELERADVINYAYTMADYVSQLEAVINTYRRRAPREDLP
jgi:hypothetical protein